MLLGLIHGSIKSLKFLQYRILSFIEFDTSWDPLFPLSRDT